MKSFCKLKIVLQHFILWSNYNQLMITNKFLSVFTLWDFCNTISKNGKEIKWEREIEWHKKKTIKTLYLIHPYSHVSNDSMYYSFLPHRCCCYFEGKYFYRIKPINFYQNNSNKTFFKDWFSLLNWNID